MEEKKQSLLKYQKITITKKMEGKIGKVGTKDWKDSKMKRIYFMWNTNHDNHGIINANKLRELLQKVITKIPS